MRVIRKEGCRRELHNTVKRVVSLRVKPEGVCDFENLNYSELATRFAILPICRCQSSPMNSMAVFVREGRRYGLQVGEGRDDQNATQVAEKVRQQVALEAKRSCHWAMMHGIDSRGAALDLVSALVGAATLRLRRNRQ